MTDVTAGLPQDAVFVVTRSVGCYETTETLVCALLTEAEAEGFAAAARQEFAAACEAVPDTLVYPDDGAPDAEWERWERRRNRAWGRFRRMLTRDPGAAPENAWSSPDDPEYWVTRVPLVAQEIETAKPPRREAGSARKGESAAGAAGVPE